MTEPERVYCVGVGQASYRIFTAHIDREERVYHADRDGLWSLNMPIGMARARIEAEGGTVVFLGFVS